MWSQLRAKQPAPSCHSLQCFYNNEQPNQLQRLLAPPPPPFPGTFCSHLSCRHFWEAVCVARRAIRLLPRSCSACSNAHCQLLPLPPSVPVGACLLPLHQPSRSYCPHLPDHRRSIFGFPSALCTATSARTRCQPLFPQPPMPARSSPSKTYIKTSLDGSISPTRIEFDRLDAENQVAAYWMIVAWNPSGQKTLGSLFAHGGNRCGWRQHSFRRFHPPPLRWVRKQVMGETHNRAFFAQFAVACRLLCPA